MEGQEISHVAHQHEELAPLYTVKRNFVQRKALTSIKEADAFIQTLAQ